MKHYRNMFVDWLRWLFYRTHSVSTSHTSSARTLLPSSKQQTLKKKKDTNTAIEAITTGQIIKFWLIGALVVYLSYLIFQSLQLLYLIITWWLISVAMEGFIRRGQAYVGRALSITIMYLLLMVFVLMGFIIIFPFLLEQLSTIIGILITYIQEIGQKISELGIIGFIDSIERFPLFLKEYFLGIISSNTSEFQNAITSHISSLVSMGSSYATSIGGLAISLVGSLLSVIIKFMIVFIVAIFFSADKDKVVDFFVLHLAKTPESSYYLSWKINLFYKKMGRWLKMQLWLCLYIFLIVYFALTVLWRFGMPLSNAFSLALMAWFTELLPYIGPIIWAIPAVVVATMIYWWKWFIVVSIIYIIIQQTESNILVPLLMKQSLGVSALLILLCALFFGFVLWFIGVLMAVPFAILLTMLFKRDFE